MSAAHPINASAASLAQLRQRAAAERPGPGTWAAWAAVAVLLGWSWRGAEIQPFALNFDAFDRIAHRFRPLRMKYFAGDDRCAKRDDAGE